MSCCGNRRTTLAVGPTMRGSAISPTSRASVSLPLRATVRFEYVGTGALTVRGAVTGINYRFDFPGARRQSDPRDAPGLASVATLRRL